MDTSRVIVFSHADVYQFELAPGDIFERKRIDEINGRHTLTLTTTRILSKGQRILTCGTDEKWREYVVTQTDDKHENGLRPIGTYTCEWSLQYDLYGVICETMPGTQTVGGVSAQVALTSLLTNTSRWGVGTISVGTNSSASFYNKSAWESLGILCEKWKCEVDYTITFDKTKVVSRSIDLYTRLGSVLPNRRFDWASDLTRIGRKESASPVYSRIKPLGKGEESYDADGEISGYGRRITIETVNGGLDYLQNDTTLDLTKIPNGSGGWEYPTTIVVNQDCTTPTELLAWAQSALSDYTEPHVTYYASVLQLESAGMNVHGIALGDTIQCVDHSFGDSGLVITGRIVKTTIDELNPRCGTDVVIGEAETNIASVFKDISARLDTAQNSLERLANSAVTTADYMSHIFDTLNDQINATGGSFYILPGRGAVTYDVDVTDPYVGSEASKVVEIRGGSIRFADSRTTQGEWDWKTIIVSGHIAANLVTAANLTTGFIGSPSGNYWNLDTGELRMAAAALSLDGKDVATTDDAIEDVIPLYAIGNSRTQAPTTGWTRTPDVTQTGYWWFKQSTVYQDGTTTTSDPVCISGRDGTDGTNGTSVTILGSYSSISALRTAHPTGSAGDSYIVSGDLYVWSVNDSDWVNVGTIQGPAGTNGVDGTNGRDGVSQYIHIRYSTVANPTSAQMTTIPSKYIGVTITTSDVAPSTASSYTWSQWFGNDGVNGVQGPSGADGTPSYTHFAYATNSTGTQGFSLVPFTGAEYIGIYSDSTLQDSSDPTDYSWSLFKGEDGVDGIDGVDGTDGIDGTDGRGIVSMVPEYYLSTSNSTQTGGQWTTELPQWESGKYIWMRTATTYDDGDTDYTGVVLAKALNKTASDAQQALERATKALGDNLLPYAGIISARYGWTMNNAALGADTSFTIATPAAQTYTYWVKTPLMDYATIHGNEVTLSFIASLDVADTIETGNLLVTAEGWHRSGGSRYVQKNLKTQEVTKTSTRYSVTFTASGTWLSSSVVPTKDMIQFGFYTRTAGATITVDEIKLEYGPNVTDWCPAKSDSTARVAVAYEEQEEVFNKLTNNGTIQGLFMEDGKLYVNGSYIQSNSITADKIDVTNLIVKKLGNSSDYYMVSGEVKRGSTSYMGMYLKSNDDADANFGFYGRKENGFMSIYGNAGEMEMNRTSPYYDFMKATRNQASLTTVPSSTAAFSETADKNVAGIHAIVKKSGDNIITGGLQSADEFCGLIFDGYKENARRAVRINVEDESIVFFKGNQGTARKISFPLPITQGGSGVSTTTQLTTTDIFQSIEDGFTITNPRLQYWGKSATLSMQVTGFSTSSKTQKIATLKTAYAPQYQIYAQSTSSNVRYITITTGITMYFDNFPTSSEGVTLYASYVMR